ncbi:hypothetical protein PIROE2DRAFT_21460 [Piromyces sp. E2]|nr:hypothetical protein PIROE2DRAFT_21460 [Piromyces sp. E2]|eukprot:OUM57660.1 hypothetical protein PIROE2DRAFT_21460 [Piromyces sp. E2]
MDVCVITGGSGDMGIETAKLLGKNKKIIIVGRNEDKLKRAIENIKKEGVEAEYFIGDVSSRDSVKELVKFAKERGNIKILIHAAGVSPTMASAETLFKINSVGTVIVNEEFLPEIVRGGVVLNVSSMSAYFLDIDERLKQVFSLSLVSEQAFTAALQEVVKNFPPEQASNYAYPISKNFVVWYTEQMALKYGKNGIRVVSISPGTFDTEMGKKEGERAAALAKMGPIGRVGQPQEIAKMMNFMVSDECSYLTGVDILYDGGAVAAYRAMRKAQAQAQAQAQDPKLMLKLKRDTYC